MLDCPMCETEVIEFHKRSHVIPEWMHDGCYDEKNRLLSVSLTEEKVQIKQSGLWGEFWCSSCETRSNEPDRYASHILSDRAPNTASAKAVVRDVKTLEGRDGPLIVEHWKGLNFSLLQKFVFVTVLRGYFGKLRKGEQEILAERHLRRMRELYLSDEVDDESYPIIINKNPDTDTFRETVIPPYQTKLKGHQRVAFKASGFMFWVWTSSHAPEEQVMATRLLKTGEIHIPHVPYEQTGQFKSLLSGIQSTLKKYPPNRFPRGD